MREPQVTIERDAEGWGGVTKSSLMIRTAWPIISPTDAGAKAKSGCPFLFTTTRTAKHLKCFIIHTRSLYFFIIDFPLFSMYIYVIYWSVLLLRNRPCYIEVWFNRTLFKMKTDFNFNLSKSTLFFLNFVSRICVKLRLEKFSRQQVQHSSSSSAV
jgi:hypothetical protein